MVHPVDRIPAHQLGRAEEPEKRHGLLQRLRQRLRTRHYSARTEKAYVDWVRHFVLYHGRRHPRTMGEREIAEYLTHLATDGKVSASTQNQALAAILFLYRHVLSAEVGYVHGIERAKRPRRLPVVLTPVEVRLLLEQLRGRTRLCALLMYGAGLRVSEGVALRVKDVDMARHEISVRGGKGDKDRHVPFPRIAELPMQRQLERERERHGWDVRRGVRTTVCRRG